MKRIGPAVSHSRATRQGELCCFSRPLYHHLIGYVFLQFHPRTLRRWSAIVMTSVALQLRNSFLDPACHSNERVKTPLGVYVFALHNIHDNAVIRTKSYWSPS